MEKIICTIIFCIISVVYIYCFVKFTSLSRELRNLFPVTKYRVSGIGIRALRLAYKNTEDKIVKDKIGKAILYQSIAIKTVYIGAGVTILVMIVFAR
jgi:hypothetical protein